MSKRSTFLVMGGKPRIRYWGSRGIAATQTRAVLTVWTARVLPVFRWRPFFAR